MNAAAASPLGARDWKDDEVFSVAGFSNGDPKALQTAICLAGSRDAAVQSLQERDPSFALVSMTSLAEFKQIIHVMERAKNDGTIEGILILERK